jgi:hypothetical protein
MRLSLIRRDSRRVAAPVAPQQQPATMPVDPLGQGTDPAISANTMVTARTAVVAIGHRHDTRLLTWGG